MTELGLLSVPFGPNYCPGFNGKTFNISEGVPDTISGGWSVELGLSTTFWFAAQDLLIETRTFLRGVGILS